ncbi:unnamed protein product [Anisakis simplex]|uniref:Uncharacterized protein n=1 Tax=Anisakis simplex TaxID=6269 RepID=A0A0M3JIS4_ANISI|nr:unnamed protein product [Anisakis simplex]
MSSSRAYGRNLPSAPWTGEEDESGPIMVAPPQGGAEFLSQKEYN